MTVLCGRHGFSSRFRDICPDCRIAELEAELQLFQKLKEAAEGVVYARGYYDSDPPLRNEIDRMNVVLAALTSGEE